MQVDSETIKNWTALAAAVGAVLGGLASVMQQLGTHLPPIARWLKLRAIRKRRKQRKARNRRLPAKAVAVSLPGATGQPIDGAVMSLPRPPQLSP